MSKQLRADDFRFVTASFLDYINNLEDDERLSELAEYIPHKGDVRWNVEKVKIVLEVHLRNHCLRGDRNEHCKKIT